MARLSSDDDVSPDSLDDKHDALFAEMAAQHDDSPRRQDVREELVAAYLPAARNIARRFANRGEAIEDLQQVAVLGLLNAIDRFDRDRGVPFMAFAVPTITGEIRRHFRDRAWAMKVPRQLKELHLAIRAVVDEMSQEYGRAPRPSAIAERLDLSLEEVLDGLAAGANYRNVSLDQPAGHDGEAALRDTVAADEDFAFESAEDRDAVKPLIEGLPQRERTVLMLRFYEDLTQAQIAKRLGISQMHVSRLLSQTLARLREGLGESR